MHELLGHYFHEYFQEYLSSGERAELRQSQYPLANSGFWVCYHYAINKINISRYKKSRKQEVKEEQLLAKFIFIFEHINFKEEYKYSKKNLGNWLKLYQDKISIHRVEAILNASSQKELLALLQEVFQIIHHSSMNMGQLIADVYHFELKPDDIRYQWAKQYFHN